MPTIVTHKNKSLLAFDICRGIWLLHNAESYLPYAAALLNREPIIFDEQEPEIQFVEFIDNEDSDSSIKQNTVVIAPLHGAMTKYYNCSSEGTSELADNLIALAQQDHIVGFVLDIDSPGGSSTAIMPLVRAIHEIRQLGKPIIAHCDQCASAALWVASQCDAIYMDNELSEIGSLGAYCTILDNRINTQTGEKIIYIYADESEDKNKGYREALEGRYETVKENLSLLVASFREAVRTGRPSLDEKADGVMTGAMFRTEEALRVGLADGQLTLQECVDNVYMRAELNN